MYVDKLDGLVDTAFYDRMSNQWRAEQARCEREIERHQNADKSYLDEASRCSTSPGTRRGCSQAKNRAENAPPQFPARNRTCVDGEVVGTFRQPSDLMAETAVLASCVAAGETAKTAKTEIWLPFLHT